MMRGEVSDDVDLRLDVDREARTGVAEAIYGPGKSPEQCCRAVAGLLRDGRGSPVVLTRASEAQTVSVMAANPGGTATDLGNGLSLVTWRPAAARVSNVVVLTAGTADVPIARETRAVLAAYGHQATLLADIGVAGVHRVLAHQQTIGEADVIIVVAGMEGALASVAAGLTRAPVIAVPTSTGYGSGLEGITALLGMLASCSPGISVVGIDNGFGAACAAVRALALRDREHGTTAQ